jgi:ABC-type sugar transport system substrate-binding protein
MKKLFVTVLVIVLMFVIAACGQGAPEEVEALEAPTTIAIEKPTPTVFVNEADVPKRIGVSLAGEGAFYDQLAVDIADECNALGYEADIKVASSAQEQSEQLFTMISAEVDIVIIDAMDVDSLETVLSEFETQKVPVINIIDSINGLVSTLITPDFLSIGKSAGRDAVELFGRSGVGCMMIKGDYDSFSMQLMTDGFMEEISKDKDVLLVSEEYCGEDEQKAYEAARRAIASEEIGFIFAQSDTLGLGALRAVEELDSDITLVVFGGDMKLIEAAVAGKVHSAIFFGTKELAKQAIYVADRFAKNETYTPPPYIELKIEAAQQADAQRYYIEDNVYAQVIGG